MEVCSKIKLDKFWRFGQVKLNLENKLDLVFCCKTFITRFNLDIEIAVDKPYWLIPVFCDGRTNPVGFTLKIF